MEHIYIYNSLITRLTVGCTAVIISACNYTARPDGRVFLAGPVTRGADGPLSWLDRNIYSLFVSPFFLLRL